MRRSLLASLSVVAAVLTATSSATAGVADLACDQQPGDRFYWTERAFCGLDLNGPERAHGIVIGNHGVSGTRVQWDAPVPPTFRLLQMRGWDVIAIKRHNLAEAQRTRLSRAVERTLAEVRHQTEAGYRKVVARRSVVRWLHHARGGDLTGGVRRGRDGARRDARPELRPDRSIDHRT